MAISRISQSTVQAGFPKFNNTWDGLSAVGAMEPISAITLSASSASVEFNNIPGTYSHLQIRALIRGTASASAISANMQFNSDTGSNYSYHELYGSGAGGGQVSAGATQTRFFLHGNAPAATALASSFGVAVMDILDYANTNKYKTTRCLNGMDVNGSGGYILLDSGNWRNTNAISSIQITPNSGNFAQYSQFSLYGIK
jgi:hypothetical protein